MQELKMRELSKKQLKVVYSTLVTVYSAYAWLKRRQKFKQRKHRRYFCREDNLDRHIYGFYEASFASIKSNEEEFFKYTRMSLPVYNVLLSLLTPKLTKRFTCYTIKPEARLAITLSYLSQGVSHQFLGWTFKVGRTTARQIIIDTCEAIWKILGPSYVNKPNVDDYKIIAKDFNNIWNLPNCIGAVDGKHIAIQSPPHSGSQFFNYKSFFSIVLLATCDARYQFTMVDAGAYGSQSDGGILWESEFGKELSFGTLPIPPDKNLHNSNLKFPHYFIGDPAFPLKENLMRPYSGKDLSLSKKNFNYRISRARVVIENAFGILVARWRILQTCINSTPGNAEKIVLATIALHNFIKINQMSTQQYCPPSFVDTEDSYGNIIPGGWRAAINSSLEQRRVGRMGANNSARHIFGLRDNLKDYFVAEGAIAQQNKIK